MKTVAQIRSQSADQQRAGWVRTARS